MKYGIHDKPPFLQAIPFAVQHVLVAFTGTLSGSLLLATGAGLDVHDTALLIQCGMFICCIASLIQSFGIGRLGIGSRLPIITTGSYTLVAPMVAMAIDPNIGLAGAFGAAFGGSLVLFLVGPLAIRYLHKYFTPVVTGSVVLSVGLCLLGTAYRYAVNSAPDSPEVWKYFAVAVFTFLLALLLNCFTHGFLQAISILIAIVVGYLLCIALGMVDFTSVGEAGLFAVPRPAAFGLSFQIGPIVTICAVHIATLMENIGDTTSIVSSAENRVPTKKELTETMRGNGLGSMFAALFNGLPVISGSENAGVIAMSGVASRYVTGLGALFLGILAFFPKFSGLLALVPYPVLGGVMMLTLGSVAANGIHVISMGSMTHRDIMILTVAIGVGIGGSYASSLLAFLPTTVLTLFTGISGTALTALLLNIILPKTAEDKAYSENFAKSVSD